MYSPDIAISELAMPFRQAGNQSSLTRLHKNLR